MWAGLALIWLNMGVAVTQLAVLRSSLPSPDWLTPPLTLSRQAPIYAASGWHLGCHCRWAMGKQDGEILSTQKDHHVELIELCNSGAGWCCSVKGVTRLLNTLHRTLVKLAPLPDKEIVCQAAKVFFSLLVIQPWANITELASVIDKPGRVILDPSSIK